jgi:hypothetical protein
MSRTLEKRFTNSATITKMSNDTVEMSAKKSNPIMNPDVKTWLFTEYG